MAAAFVAHGYDVVSGGTDNHLLLIDLRSKGLTGKEAEALLGEADITVNKNMVPYDTESPFVTSGIRLGTPAVTTRGMDPASIREIVGLIDRVLSKPESEGTREMVRREVFVLSERFPLYDHSVLA
jgi:glycine hydroxymethyltransferase